MSAHMIFRVECTPLASGQVQVLVDAGPDREARITAPTAALCFGYVAAFMTGVVEAGELEAAWRMPSAPDGPGEQG